MTFRVVATSFSSDPGNEHHVPESDDVCDTTEEAAGSNCAVASEENDGGGVGAWIRSSARGSGLRKGYYYDDTDDAISSQKNTTRTDALYEHAGWKAKKMQAKREDLEAVYSFTPRTNTKSYRPSGGTVSLGRSSVYERLYFSGSRQRAAVCKLFSY